MSSSWPTVAPALTPALPNSSINGGAVGSARVLGHRGLYYPADYETALRHNPPRVEFDNANIKYPQFTLLKVCSANRYGCLLEVVQLLTDLGLVIVKGFIVSDGQWFFDEFYVTDAQGSKITDEGLMALIQEALGATPSRPPPPLPASAAYGIPQGTMLSPHYEEPANWQTPSALGTPSVPSNGGAPSYLGSGRNVPGAQGSALAGGGGAPAAPPAARSPGGVRIEMTGRDRPGLLSEVSSLLAEHKCNVVDAQIWTHNQHVACVVHITSDLEAQGASAPGAPGQGPGGLPAGGSSVRQLTERLRQLMQGEDAGALQGDTSGTPAPEGAREGQAGSTGPPGGSGSAAGDEGTGGSVRGGDAAGGLSPAALGTGTPSLHPHTWQGGGGLSLTDSSSGSKGRDSLLVGSPAEGAAVFAQAEPPLGTVYPGPAKGMGAAGGMGLGLGGGAVGGQAWGLNPCSTKLERRLHQLLAASEGLQEERRGELGARGLFRGVPCAAAAGAAGAGGAGSGTGAGRPGGVPVGSAGSSGDSGGRGDTRGGYSLGQESGVPGVSPGAASEGSLSASPGAIHTSQSQSGSSRSSSSSSIGSAGGGGGGGGIGGVTGGVRSKVKGASRPDVTVGMSGTGYSLVTIWCRDRQRLLFDCVCTLTDMHYVVNHGTIDTERTLAFQEYYIRRLDGTPVVEKAEQERIARALESAIERRSPVEEGECVRVEVSGTDRVGLLSDLTKAFLRHNLSVVSATVSTKGSAVVDSFVLAPTVAPGSQPSPPSAPGGASPGVPALASPAQGPPAGVPSASPSAQGQQMSPAAARASPGGPSEQQQERDRKGGAREGLAGAAAVAGGAAAVGGAGAEREQYVRRMVDEIRQELGGAAQITVKPAALASPSGAAGAPGAQGGMRQAQYSSPGTGKGQGQGQGQGQEQGQGLRGAQGRCPSGRGGSNANWASPDRPPLPYGAGAGGPVQGVPGQYQYQHPGAYQRQQQTSLTQMLVQQSERLFATLGFGGQNKG